MQQTTVRINKKTSEDIEKLAIIYSNKYKRMISKAEMIEILIEEWILREKNIPL